MTGSYDAIVFGSGVAGVSVAFHLANLGGLKVCVVNSGYLILAPEGAFAGKLRANLAMQSGVGAERRQITKAAAI